jgi:hypothetical protein
MYILLNWDRGNGGASPTEEISSGEKKGSKMQKRNKDRKSEEYSLRRIYNERNSARVYEDEVRVKRIYNVETMR